MLQTLKSVKRNKAQGGVSRWALYHLLHTLQSHCNLLLSTSFFLLLRHLHLCHAVRACRKLKVTLIIPNAWHLGHSSSIPEQKPNSYIMVVVVVVCHEKSNSITNSYYASCTGNSFSSSSCEPSSTQQPVQLAAVANTQPKLGNFGNFSITTGTYDPNHEMLVTISFFPQHDLQQYLNLVSNPNSPAFHAFLSPTQIASLVGSTAYQQAVSYFQSYGL